MRARQLNEHLPQRWLALALFLFLTSSSWGQAVNRQFIDPADISYKGVPGYWAAPGSNFGLEWNTASQGVEEPNVPSSATPMHGLRVRWLGTAGYEISDDYTTILIDPFVSRPTTSDLLRKVHIDTATVDHYVLAAIPKQNLKAILVSHNHYDHVEDVPYILAQYPDPETRPLVVGDPNVTALIKSYTAAVEIPWAGVVGGLENSHTMILDFSTNDSFLYVGQFGEFEIWACRSIHPAYHFIPWRGPEGQMKGSPPYRISEYKTYHHTAIEYLIKYKELRIFFTETPIVRHANDVGPVDILIQGIAARKGDDTISETLAALRPRYVIPTHYDNFFKPIREFHQFDYTIAPLFSAPPSSTARIQMLDFSRFEQFLNDFAPLYVTRANEMLGNKAPPLAPQLRLMKMLYYYSLGNLVGVDVRER